MEDGGEGVWRVVEGGGGWCLYLDFFPRLFLAGLPGDTEEQVDAEVHREPVSNAVTSGHVLITTISMLQM